MMCSGSSYAVSHGQSCQSKLTRVELKQCMLCHPYTGYYTKIDEVQISTRATLNVFTKVQWTKKTVHYPALAWTQTRTSSTPNAGSEASLRPASGAAVQKWPASGAWPEGDGMIRRRSQWGPHYNSYLILRRGEELKDDMLEVLEVDLRHRDDVVRMLGDCQRLRQWWRGRVRRWYRRGRTVVEAQDVRLQLLLESLLDVVDALLVKSHHLGNNKSN